MRTKSVGDLAVSYWRNLGTVEGGFLAASLLHRFEFEDAFWFQQWNATALQTFVDFNAVG